MSPDDPLAVAKLAHYASYLINSSPTPTTTLQTTPTPPEVVDIRSVFEAGVALELSCSVGSYTFRNQTTVRLRYAQQDVNNVTSPKLLQFEYEVTLPTFHFWPHVMDLRVPIKPGMTAQNFGREALTRFSRTRLQLYGNCNGVPMAVDTLRIVGVMAQEGQGTSAAALAAVAPGDLVGEVVDLKSRELSRTDQTLFLPNSD